MHDRVCALGSLHACMRAVRGASGCGSARGLPLLTIAVGLTPWRVWAAGCKVVVAESYARIFFRNSISTGELYPCETPERLCDTFETGEEVEVDMEADTITRCSTGAAPQAPPPPWFMPPAFVHKCMLCTQHAAHAWPRHLNLASQPQCG